MKKPEGESLKIGKDVLARVRAVARENRRTIKAQIEVMLEQQLAARQTRTK